MEEFRLANSSIKLLCGNNMSSLLLQYCRLSLIGQELLIVCPSDKVFRGVYLRRKYIIQLIQKSAKFSEITIVAGDRKISFPAITDVEFVVASTMIQPDTVLTRVKSISDEDLIPEVLGCQYPASVVRFSDNLGLFSNSLIERSSGAKPNDWVGKNMADYWVGEELSRFRTSLLRDLELKDYSYNAYLFTGEKARFTVDARLVVYRGDLSRVVKCLETKILV